MVSSSPDTASLPGRRPPVDGNVGHAAGPGPPGARGSARSQSAASTPANQDRHVTRRVLTRCRRPETCADTSSAKCDRTWHHHRHRRDQLPDRRRGAGSPQNSTSSGTRAATAASICPPSTAGSSNSSMSRFRSNGRPVSSRTRAIRRWISAAGRLAPPSTPQPPAADTAAASSGPADTSKPTEKTGQSMPSASHSGARTPPRTPSSRPRSPRQPRTATATQPRPGHQTQQTSSTCPTPQLLAWSGLDDQAGRPNDQFATNRRSHADHRQCRQILRAGARLPGHCLISVPAITGGAPATSSERGLHIMQIVVSQQCPVMPPSGRHWRACRALSSTSPADLPRID